SDLCSSDLQAVFRYVSIKKALFSFFFTIHVKCCFCGIFALLVNRSASKSMDLPIDTYRQTGKKRTAPIDAVLFDGKRRPKLSVVFPVHIFLEAVFELV